MKRTRTVIVSEFTDDLTGEELSETEGETVIFGWNGRWYEIDLAVHRAQAFRDQMAPYVEHGRDRTVQVPQTRAGRTRVRNPSDRRAEEERRQQNVLIREWARRNGHQMPERGRISEEIRQAYMAENLTPEQIADANRRWRDFDHDD